MSSERESVQVLSEREREGEEREMVTVEDSAEKAHLSHLKLERFRRSPCIVYLDTTYAKPCYNFPLQEEMIAYVVKHVYKVLKVRTERDTERQRDRERERERSDVCFVY